MKIIFTETHSFLGMCENAYVFVDDEENNVIVKECKVVDTINNVVYFCKPTSDYKPNIEYSYASASTLGVKIKDWSNDSYFSRWTKELNFSV